MGLTGTQKERRFLLTSLLFMLNMERNTIVASESLTGIHYVVSERHDDMGRKKDDVFTEGNKKGEMCFYSSFSLDVTLHLFISFLNRRLKENRVVRVRS